MTILAVELLHYFNPRPPRGGRRILVFIRVVKMEFQSTPPARGATSITGYNVWYTYISIHAPREGGDSPYGKIRYT